MTEEEIEIDQQFEQKIESPPPSPYKVPQEDSKEKEEASLEEDISRKPNKDCYCHTAPAMLVHPQIELFDIKN